MKMLINGWFLVLLSLLNASFALAFSSGELGEKSDKYGENFSYFVTTSSIKGSVLHVDTGMAVAIINLKDRCILATAKHIVQDVSSVMVAPLNNGMISRKKIKADVIYKDRKDDVAFLSFATQAECVTPNVAIDENELIGSSAMAFKCSLDSGCYTTRGRIKDFYKIQDGRDFMVADMSIEKGFSGSGVFNNRGNLIGLVSGKDNNAAIAYLISGPRIIDAFRKSKK
jgi:S1-C subfamily serine protease